MACARSIRSGRVKFPPKHPIQPRDTWCNRGKHAQVFRWVHHPGTRLITRASVLSRRAIDGDVALISWHPPGRGLGALQCYNKWGQYMVEYSRIGRPPGHTEVLELATCRRCWCLWDVFIADGGVLIGEPEVHGAVLAHSRQPEFRFRLLLMLLACLVGLLGWIRLTCRSQVVLQDSYEAVSTTDGRHYYGAKRGRGAGVEGVFCDLPSRRAARMVCSAIPACAAIMPSCLARD